MVRSDPAFWARLKTCTMSNLVSKSGSIFNALHIETNWSIDMCRRRLAMVGTPFVYKKGSVLPLTDDPACEADGPMVL